MARKTGQIVRRGSNVWLVRTYSGRDPETKKRIYIAKTVHGGIRDAQAELNRMLSRRDLRRNIRSSRQTLGDYLDYWLEICAKPRLRPRSFRDYAGLLARYVSPQLGAKRLSEVSGVEIQAFYITLLDRGLSPRTIRYTNAVLHSAFQQAVRWNLLLANCVEGVGLPRQSRRRVGVLTVEQARTFIKAIAGHPYESLFALAITTGMRPSEYLALTWPDLDLDRGTVSVSKTLELRRGGWLFEDTKRERSRRMIKLQDWVVDRLQQHRDTAKSTVSDLVFTSARGGPIRETRLVSNQFKPLLNSAGLPNVRLYDLRHTAATLGLAAGVPPKVVSEQLGHASVAFTLEVYSHVLPHMQDAAAARVQSLLIAA